LGCFLCLGLAAHVNSQTFALKNSVIAEQKLKKKQAAPSPNSSPLSLSFSLQNFQHNDH